MLGRHAHRPAKRPAAAAQDFNALWTGTDCWFIQGCTRNEYHEYRVEDQGFGEKGCLFFSHRAATGPLAYGPCQTSCWWNRRSSQNARRRALLRLHRPDFPQAYPFFFTRNIEGIPRQLPDGVDPLTTWPTRAMAAAPAPPD